MRTMKYRIICILLAVGIMAIILPVVYYCLLSIPFSDDFSNAQISLEYMNKYGGFIKGGFEATRDKWLEFQGTYTGIFLMYGFNPYARWGMFGLRIFNAIGMLLFYVGLLKLTWVFCKTRKNHILLTLWVYMILVFWITNNYMYPEVYTWNTVICIYMAPFAFLLFGVAEYIEYARKGGYRCLGACLCAFFMGGAPINLATLGCGLFFLVTFYYYSRTDIKKRKYLLIPFLGAIVSTLLNVLAPGNYMRWDAYEIETNVFAVIWASFYNVISRICQMVLTRPFILTGVVMFVIIFSYAENIEELQYKSYHPVLIAALFIVACTIVNFPYFLGGKIQNTRHIIENRAFFVQDMTIYILMVIWLFYLAMYLHQNHPDFSLERSHYILVAILGISSLVLVTNGFDKEDELTTPYMMKRIADGSAHAYSDYQESIIKIVQDSEDDECIIYYDDENYEKENPIIIGLRLLDDRHLEDGGRNKYMAHFFGKNNIRIVYGYD